MKYIFFMATIIIQFSCTSNVDIVAEKENLIQTDIEFAQYSVKNGAAEAFKEYLTKDALQLPAGNNPLQGVENIYNKMKDNQGNYLLDWSPHYAEVSKSGDLGYTWGTYSLAYKNENGEEQKSYGKYLNVWKKQADGKWKVAVDMGNSSPTPVD